MASPINKKVLERLAEMARLELQEREAEKQLEDLKNILNHFNELQELDTTDVESEIVPEKTRKIFREDTERENTDIGKGKEAFPESENGYLTIPPVFKK